MGVRYQAFRGVLWLIYTLTAAAAEILGAESLFRLTLAAELIAAGGYVAVTGLLYILLRPVNRALAVIAALFSLTGIAVGEATLVDSLAALNFLETAGAGAAFTTDQLEALALASLESQATGFVVSLVFFGFYCLSIGYLIIRSSFCRVSSVCSWRPRDLPI